MVIGTCPKTHDPENGRKARGVEMALSRLLPLLEGIFAFAACRWRLTGAMRPFMSSEVEAAAADSVAEGCFATTCKARPRRGLQFAALSREAYDVGGQGLSSEDSLDWRKCHHAGPPQVISPTPPAGWH